MAIFSDLSKVVFYVPHFMSYFFSIFQKKKKKRNETFETKLFIFSTLCSKHSLQFFHTMDNLKLFSQVWTENSHHLSPIQNYFLGICFSRLSIRNSIVIPNSIDEYSSLSLPLARFCKIQLCRSRVARNNARSTSIRWNSRIEHREKR